MAPLAETEQFISQVDTVIESGSDNRLKRLFDTWTNGFRRGRTFDSYISSTDRDLSRLDHPNPLSGEEKTAIRAAAVVFCEAKETPIKAFLTPQEYKQYQQGAEQTRSELDLLATRRRTSYLLQAGSLIDMRQHNHDIDYGCNY